MANCRIRLFLALLLLLPTAAFAHPHMFIQTAIAILFNDAGFATGIRVTWTYDSFTSLQILTDHGMEEDGNGQLSAGQIAELNGFDMTWQPGYQGDSFARLDQQALNLSGPRDWTLSYADGGISTTHVRDFDAPQDLRDHVLGISTYDPTYYVLYDLSPDIVLVNPPPKGHCRAIYRPADTAKAKKDLEAQLRAMQNDPEINFPAVGKQFAAEAWIICASGS